jgi:hypothetical protein
MKFLIIAKDDDLRNVLFGMYSFHEFLALTSARDYNEANVAFTLDIAFNFLLCFASLNVNNFVKFFVKKEVFPVGYIWVEPNNF